MPNTLLIPTILYCLIKKLWWNIIWNIIWPRKIYWIWRFLPYPKFLDAVILNKWDQISESWAAKGVQSFSVWLFASPWTAACQASLSFTISRNLLRFMSIESVMPFNHLILCHPFLWLSIFPSIRVSSSESALHIRWPKYCSVIFSISPSNEYLGFISFRIDWFDLFEVQGTLRSLPHHHNLKASILQHSAFVMVQLSHPYMTTGKIIALTIQTFVGKVMFLLLDSAV